MKEETKEIVMSEVDTVKQMVGIQVCDIDNQIQHNHNSIMQEMKTKNKKLQMV